jgi:hypothetical protein
MIEVIKYTRINGRSTGRPESTWHKSAAEAEAAIKAEGFALISQGYEVDDKNGLNLVDQFGIHRLVEFLVLGGE